MWTLKVRFKKDSESIWKRSEEVKILPCVVNGENIVQDLLSSWHFIIEASDIEVNRLNIKKNVDKPELMWEN